MSFDILKKELNGGNIRNLYLFYGPEVFLLKKYVSLIENNVVAKDFKDMNFTILEGKIDQQKLIDTCQTMPFLSQKRLVIAKDTGLFKPAKGGDAEQKKKKKAKDKDLLTDFLKNIPDHVCLLFSESEIDKRIKYLDTIKAKGLVVEFGHQKAADLTKWVMVELKGQNIAISQEDAGLLIEYSEPGMTDIYSQIQKLSLYTVDKGRVSRQDIEKVCTKSIKSKIFDLTDAISERDVKKSLILLNDMIELKEPVARLFFMIAKQFRSILTAKTLIDKGANKSVLASSMGVHPFVAEKLYKQAKYFSEEELKNAVKESYNMDLANKNGMIDDRIAAELLITKFAGNTRS